MGRCLIITDSHIRAVFTAYWCGQLNPLLVSCGWSSMPDVPTKWSAEWQPVLRILPVYFNGFCVCIPQTWHKPFSVMPEPPAPLLTPIWADSLGWVSWRDKYISCPPVVLISPFTLSISHHHRCCIRPNVPFWWRAAGGRCHWILYYIQDVVVLKISNKVCVRSLSISVLRNNTS